MNNNLILASAFAFLSSSSSLAGLDQSIDPKCQTQLSKLMEKGVTIKRENIGSLYSSHRYSWSTKNPFLNEQGMLRDQVDSYQQRCVLGNYKLKFSGFSKYMGRYTMRYSDIPENRGGGGCGY